MTQQATRRICVDPRYLSALRRDGIGWGHDDCGCFDDSAARCPGPLARLLQRLKGA